MAINWLIKSLCNALSAKLSKTNPPFVLQYCMQGENRVASAGATALIRAESCQKGKVTVLWRLAQGRWRRHRLQLLLQSRCIYIFNLESVCLKERDGAPNTFCVCTKCVQVSLSPTETDVLPPSPPFINIKLTVKLMKTHCVYVCVWLGGG